MINNLILFNCNAKSLKGFKKRGICSDTHFNKLTLTLICLSFEPGRLMPHAVMSTVRCLYTISNKKGFNQENWAARRCHYDLDQGITVEVVK